MRECVCKSVCIRERQSVRDRLCGCMSVIQRIEVSVCEH